MIIRKAYKFRLNTNAETEQLMSQYAVIIERVAKIFDVLPESILNSVRGRRNLPRWVAMYLCQEIGGHRFVDIALKFGLKRTGSIPTIIGKLKKLLRKEKI